MQKICAETGFFGFFSVFWGFFTFYVFMIRDPGRAKNRRALSDAAAN